MNVYCRSAAAYFFASSSSVPDAHHRRGREAVATRVAAQHSGASGALTAARTRRRKHIVAAGLPPEPERSAQVGAVPAFAFVLVSIVGLVMGLIMDLMILAPHFNRVRGTKNSSGVV